MVTKKQPKQSKSKTELGRVIETPERKPRKLKKNKEKLAAEQSHGHTHAPERPWKSTSNKKNRHGKTKKELQKSNKSDGVTESEKA